MRILLLAGVASLAMAAAPAFAAPLQIGVDLKYHSYDVNQGPSSQFQKVNNANHIYTHHNDPSAVQIGLNASIWDSDSTQKLKQVQVVNGPSYHGGAWGTQAIQIGANVNLGTDNNDQSLTQKQIVNESGYSSGVQAVQVGANVAVHSDGGSQTMTQTQIVNQ